MKIFQPIVSGSAYFPNLVTSSTAVTNVVMYGTNGQLFVTASSAIGGGGSGTPGGSTTQIQYNNNGAFGGVDKLKFDGTNLVGTGSFTGSFTGQFNGSITTAVTASYAKTLILDEALMDFAKVASTIVGSDNLFQQATGSYTSAHCKYTVYKSTNSRAGEFVTSWNGTTVSYYDNATVDIGNTADIVFQSLISNSPNPGEIQINAVAASAAWTVKMVVTYL